MSKNRLIVISFDAMVSEDIDLLSSCPLFSQFVKNGCRITRMQTIYPSLTYPSHVSILTGVRPGVHGIANNEPLEVGNLKTPWYWFHDPVKVEDLHDVAKKAGLRTASVFWPVSGGHKNIDYLVPEYWAQGKDDTLEKAYKRAGTTDEVFEEIVRPNIEYMETFEYINSDIGKAKLASVMIRRYKPDLLTVHFGQIDSFRHKYGIFNDKVRDGVLRSEELLGMIVDATKDAGVYEDTDFVIVSDHGQINYTRKMSANVLFVKEGYIKTDSEGNITDWSAYIKSANYSAHVYLKDKSDERLKNEIYEKLCKWAKDGDKGIGQVLTAQEAWDRYGLKGDFSFVIESDETTLFNSNWREPMFVPMVPEEEGYLRGSHGHNPDVGPQPVFLAFGPHIKKGLTFMKARVIDEAPTFAAILGLELPDAEGRVLSEIFLDR